MASITDFDFSKCRYNPRDKDFIKTISSDIPAFKDTPLKEKQKIFSYVVIMYDKESPLHRKYPEYYERKIEASKIVGLPKNRKGAHTQETKEILESREKATNKLIVAYLANTGDVEYMMLVNEWAMFQGYTSGVLSADYDTNTHKILKTISDSIKVRTRSVFGSGKHDELSKIRTLLYEMAEKDRHRLNIENVVKLVSEDGDLPPDWSPYGVGYEVDELKYEGDE
jgi:hypothetical protein